MPTYAETVLGLSGNQLDTANSIENLSAELALALTNQGNTGITATLLKNQAREMSAEAHGGDRRSDEYVLDALVTLSIEAAAKYGVQLTASRAPDEDDFEIGLTRAIDIEDPSEAKLWASQEIARLSAVGRHAGLLSLAGPRSGNAYDDAYSAATDTADSDLEAETSRLATKFNAKFCHGKNGPTFASAPKAYGL